MPFMAMGVGLRAILSSHVTGVRISSVHQWRFVLLCCVGFGVLVVVVSQVFGCTATIVVWCYRLCLPSLDSTPSVVGAGRCKHQHAALPNMPCLLSVYYLFTPRLLRTPDQGSVSIAELAIIVCCG
jgi:hypothetical protein